MAKKSDRASRESSLAAGWTVEADAEIEKPSTVFESESTLEHGRAAEDATIVDQEEVSATGQVSNSVMVLLGIFGGLYLAYAWIWLTWAKYMASVSAAQLSVTNGSLGAGAQLLLYWLAPLAPLLWFIAVLVSQRGASSKKIGIWLAIGAVVLAPLPYLLAGSQPSQAIVIGLFPLWGAM